MLILGGEYGEANKNGRQDELDEKAKGKLAKASPQTRKGQAPCRASGQAARGRC